MLPGGGGGARSAGDSHGPEAHATRGAGRGARGIRTGWKPMLPRGAGRGGGFARARGPCNPARGNWLCTTEIRDGAE